MVKKRTPKYLNIISTNCTAVLLLLIAPNVKGEWVDSNFQIIDLLVPPRVTGVVGTLTFVYIANFATLQPWLHLRSFTCWICNSLYTHKGPVLLCAPPRHRAMWLNFLAQGKSLPPSGIELGTFGLQQRSESVTLATAPARQRCVQHMWLIVRVLQNKGR